MNDQLRDDPRYQKHDNRPDLAGEHPVGDTLQIIAAVLFFAAILLDFFIFGYPQRFNKLISFWMRLPVSIACFVFSGWLMQRGLKIVFGEYREEPIMITGDIFGWMRHPVYFSAILVYIGVLLLVLSPLGAIVFVGVLSLYYWLSKEEEERLLNIFGEEYKVYQQEVPMWLPFKLGRKDSR